MKRFSIILFIGVFSIGYSQCNYKSYIQDGVTVKQFTPKPIGGDNQKQIAVSISNINGYDNLMLTIRLKDRIVISKKIKINLSNGSTLDLVAERSGNDFIGGSPITHLIFSLKESSKSSLQKYKISSIILNNNNKISAKMNSGYILENLNCLN